jgi:peptidoglycan/LPS O-acetylase OafA/YrhL
MARMQPLAHAPQTRAQSRQPCNTGPLSRVRPLLAGAAAFFFAAAAHATALDGMFNHWASKTWYFGAPLGFGVVLFAWLFKEAVEEKQWRAIVYALLALVLAPVFFFWAFLGMDDPLLLPILVLIVGSSVGVVYVIRFAVLTQRDRDDA